jgi:hypothetical protein
MDTKTYAEWREALKKYVVLLCGQVQATFNTKKEADDLAQAAFPSRGHESERVQVRKKSPRGVRIGEWLWPACRPRVGGTAAPGCE